jgi:four helix bundle protein
MLRIYDDILALVRDLAGDIERIERRDADLARQLRRAASSIALNTMEGGGLRGGNRRLRYESALGSLREVTAVLDVAEALRMVVRRQEVRERMDKIAATLFRLTRR